ncbi:Ig-like domain-containing protein, partial [Leptospira santarosai]|nr:Ig-like domain-containing protein [Leptospira santarosai]
VATISADKVAPTVTKVEAKAENQVVVSFSEKVDLTNAKFTITDSTGKKVLPTVTPSALDEEKLTVNLDLSAKLSGGNYTVTVSDVVDKSLSQNKITAITLPFAVTDKTPMTLTDAVATVVTNATAKEQYVYV